MTHAVDRSVRATGGTVDTIRGRVKEMALAREEQYAQKDPTGSLPDRILYSDIAEHPPEEGRPLIDRENVDENDLSPLQLEWRRSGRIILSNVIPENLIMDYEEWRHRRRLPDAFGAVPNEFAYLFVPEVRRIALLQAVSAVIQHLFDVRLCLHLDISNWKSTERDWHQDGFSDESEYSGYYAAAWFALEDIHPDSGPFENVPGSNRWGLTRVGKVLSLCPQAHSTPELWPQFANRVVRDACQNEIVARGATIQAFLARRGDVLIWGPQLVHRGSRPLDPARPRKALVAHYSSSRKLDPRYHSVLLSDEGVPYVHHRLLPMLVDHPAESGVVPLAALGR